jgi:hypothetical protein
VFISSQKHSPDPISVSTLQKEIQTVLKEITAFRDFYLRTASIEALAYPLKEK